MLKGLKNFTFGYGPHFIFKHLLEVRQGVYLNAPLASGDQALTPVVFSHGVA
jgi:hypothetical protein